MIPVPVAIMMTSFVGSLEDFVPGLDVAKEVRAKPVTGSKYSARLTQRLMDLPSNRSPKRVEAISTIKACDCDRLLRPRWEVRR